MHTTEPYTSPSRVFEPQPGDELLLFGERFIFPQDPETVLPMPESCEGRRAIIYRLRGGQGQDLALKVFREQFQDASLPQVCEELEPFRALEGLRAANRRVLLPGDPAVQHHPQLRYAMLMPWISGKTWRELLDLASKGQCLKSSWALHLCIRFLAVLRGLEEMGAAHTDVAGGNVVLNLETLDIQLVDLEDIYLPGKPPGPFINLGISGYCHPTNPSLSCPEGDRYASAILAAEILLLSRPEFAAKSNETGFFGGNHRNQDAAARFQEAQGWLRGFSPAFAELLQRAWSSASLAACPRLSELHDALAPLALGTPREPPPALIPWPPASSSRWISWEPIPPGSAQNGRIQWEPKPDTSVSNTASAGRNETPVLNPFLPPTSTVQSSGRDLGLTLLVIFILLCLLFAFFG